MPDRYRVLDLRAGDVDRGTRLGFGAQKSGGNGCRTDRFFPGYFFGTALLANIMLGYVVDHLGWDWSFIILLGACALAFIFTAFTVREEQYLVKESTNKH